MRGARSLIILLAAAMIAAACGSPATPQPASSPHDADPVADRPPPDSPDAAALAAGLNAVGFDLFRYAAGESDGDVVLSPLSIGIAFGMADVGATGEVAEILADLFAYPVEGEARWSAFNSLEQSVTDVGDPTVRLANRMFPDTAFETADGYDERLARWFGAGSEPLPLQSDSDAARERINGWVSEQTEGLIPDLLPDGSPDASTVLILVNALYLEAKWRQPFGKYPTEDAPFTRLDGTAVTVPLMQERELYSPAVAADDYVAAEIPYQGDDLSMLVIVPEEGRYPDVEDRLDGGLVAEIDATVEAGTVELWLPRFDSDTRLDLEDAFEGLGVTGLFGVPGWDGIAPGIWLDSAVHAADISVDEEGTVAAAATALGFDESGPGRPDVVVRADRPFLYLIRHVPTGAVLFVGRVLDPS